MGGFIRRQYVAQIRTLISNLVESTSLLTESMQMCIYANFAVPTEVLLPFFERYGNRVFDVDAWMDDHLGWTPKVSSKQAE